MRSSRSLQILGTIIMLCGILQSYSASKIDKTKGIFAKSYAENISDGINLIIVTAGVGLTLAGRRIEEIDAKECNKKCQC